MKEKLSPVDNLKKFTSKALVFSILINASILIILDQISKYIIVKYLPLYKSIPVINNFFDITHIRNTGIAFGLFSTDPSKIKTLILCFSTCISLILIVYLLTKMSGSTRTFSFSLSFIIAGALGNFIDRLFRGGEVVDFLDFHWYNLHWPSFNLADTSISIGVGLLILDTIINKEAIKENSTSSVKDNSDTVKESNL
jgi:signal peptidase II